MENSPPQTLRPRARFQEEQNKTPETSKGHLPVSHTPPVTLRSNINEPKRSRPLSTLFSDVSRPIVASIYRPSHASTMTPSPAQNSTTSSSASPTSTRSRANTSGKVENDELASKTSQNESTVSALVAYFTSATTTTTPPPMVKSSSKTLTPLKHNNSSEGTKDQKSDRVLGGKSVSGKLKLNQVYPPAARSVSSVAPSEVSTPEKKTNNSIASATTTPSTPSAPVSSPSLVAAALSAFRGTPSSTSIISSTVNSPSTAAQTPTTPIPLRETRSSTTSAVSLSSASVTSSSPIAIKRTVFETGTPTPTQMSSSAPTSASTISRLPRKVSNRDKSPREQVTKTNSPRSQLLSPRSSSSGVLPSKIEKQKEEENATTDGKKDAADNRQRRGNSLKDVTKERKEKLSKEGRLQEESRSQTRYSPKREGPESTPRSARDKDKSEILSPRIDTNGRVKSKAARESILTHGFSFFSRKDKDSDSEERRIEKDREREEKENKEKEAKELGRSRAKTSGKQLVKQERPTTPREKLKKIKELEFGEHLELSRELTSLLSPRTLQKLETKTSKGKDEPFFTSRTKVTKGARKGCQTENQS
eukprot:TRINITY_DN2116_c0_g1_i1.p1 TRINITY_DN2116_c0_g1~~TRINITY_DN2116_c0_g1_i1.p1  ORF type:complete len:590 (-),score=134.60 TRINITY_DN2116_c0_g1_i1:330-2099(-)